MVVVLVVELLLLILRQFESELEIGAYVGRRHAFGRTASYFFRKLLYGVLSRGVQIFQKFGSHIKVLGARRVTYSRFP